MEVNAMDKTGMPSRRRMLRFLSGTMPLAWLAACGGGTEEDKAGAPISRYSPLPEGTLVDVANELERRHAGVLPPTLFAELRQYTASESAVSPGSTKSFLEGAWDGEVRRDGTVRVAEFQVFNGAPFGAVFGNPVSVALGSTRFGGSDLLSGSGSAFVINPDNNLRLNNDSLQLFLGFKPGASATSGAISTVSDYLFLTTGEVHDSQGALAGIGLNIWSGQVSGEIFYRDSAGNLKVDRLKPRYRFFVLQDNNGGPAGLRNDFDSLLIARTS
jgi:hypothetical protein